MDSTIEQLHCTLNCQGKRIWKDDKILYIQDSQELGKMTRFFIHKKTLINSLQLNLKNNEKRLNRNIQT